MNMCLGCIWRSSGKPRQGEEFELMRQTRLQFKYALRYVKQHENIMRRDATDLGPLKSTHEEYDTILALHAVHSQLHTVVVSSRDTDCSPTSRITRSKNALSAYLDEVRHIKETAVHTH